MFCRHTVPDWHRYVDSTAAAAPIFVGCRLLVGPGGPVMDARSIACGYWGQQRHCPLYVEPGAPLEARTTAAVSLLASEDVCVAVDAAWPVRVPGAKDGLRLVVIGLGSLSLVLLVWAALLGISVLNGRGAASAHLHVSLVAGAASLATIGLVALRGWARR